MQAKRGSEESSGYKIVRYRGIERENLKVRDDRVERGYGLRVFFEGSVYYSVKEMGFYGISVFRKISFESRQCF